MTDDVVSGIQLNIIESYDDAESFMRWLGERRPILACDTETTGLNWWTPNFLRLVQFGDLSTGWVIPWRGWGGLAKEALKRYNGPLVFHNAKFDIKGLETSGVPVKRDKLHDTRSMYHLLDPAHNTGLKELGVRFVDGNADAGQSALKRGMTQNKWTWATVPEDFPPYWIYSALDPVLTAHLYQQGKPQMIGDLGNVYELEVAVLQILDDIERKGARVDVEYCEEQRDRLLNFAEDARDWIDQNYGFGPGNHKKVAAQLQRDGVILSKKTPSGGWSMDAEVHEEIVAETAHPLAKTVLNVRTAEKMGNSYFGNYVEFAIDGILHADINPLGTRTGRRSVSRPPLQQIPRTKLLRDPFIAGEGNRLVSVDFDQLQMRLMACLSRDRGLIDAFLTGGDFFCNMVGRLYGETNIVKSDPRRTPLKNASYALAFGAGDKKFAATAGVPEGPASVAFVQQFDHMFPGIKLYSREIEALALENGTRSGTPYVTTPMGRRQPADYEKGQWKMYALVNYVIQGAEADLFKQTLVDIDRSGLLEYMILPVHDEMVFDVPEGLAEEVAHDVVDIFQTDRGMEVPLTAGSDILTRWGDKY